MPSKVENESRSRVDAEWYTWLQHLHAYLDAAGALVDHFLIPTTVWVSGITAREKKNTVSLWLHSAHEPQMQHISADLAALQHLLPPAPRKRAQRARRTTAGLVGVDVARPMLAIAAFNEAREEIARPTVAALQCSDRREGDEQVAFAGVSASSSTSAHRMNIPVH